MPASSRFPSRRETPEGAVSTAKRGSRAWTYVHSTFDQKALETSDSSFHHCFQVSLRGSCCQMRCGRWVCVAYLIPGNDASPEGDIGVTLALRSGTLDAQILDSCRWRNRVERHIYHSRHTAGHCCAGASLEALPVRATGFVQVHMRTAMNVTQDTSKAHSALTQRDRGELCVAQRERSGLQRHTRLGPRLQRRSA